MCIRDRISDSASRIAPLLLRRLPVDMVLIRRLDVSRTAVETVGVAAPGPVDPPLQARTECTIQQFEALLRWCRQGSVLRGPAEEVAQRLPGLLPEAVTCHLLAGSLTRDVEPVGVLILTTCPPRAFKPEHDAMLQALLEPFAVALENDRRLHELQQLREAVEADNRSLLSRLGRQDISDAIVGAETGLRGVMERVELVAPSDAPVLILGETGSGKEVVARAIHQRSARREGPFLRVNCGAIPSELIDSELFGHERGSFTGAVSLRKGWFERADGGTLFLDEVAELPLAAQVRLLRVLQDGSFERVGGQKQLHVSVRVVAATNADLRTMVADARFREDLWYRLAVFPVQIPPLRERVDDIAPLAAHFALRAAKRLGTMPLVPTPEHNELLVRYTWPGNARELAAVIERAAILGNGRRLEIAKALGVTTAPAPERPAPAEAPPEAPVQRDHADPLDAAVVRHIEQALARTRGRIEGPHGAAALLKINPNTLRGRMRKLGIDWRRFRSSPTTPPGHAASVPPSDQ